MTMIPSGGAAVFSSPPLCRARGLCFFFPLCSALFLFSLSGSAAVLSVVAGRNGGGAGGGATVVLLLLCFVASSSSVSIFSVFLLLFLTVQGLLPMTGRTVAACCWRRCFQRRRERGRRTAWMVVDLSSSSLRFFFLVLCSPLFLFFSVSSSPRFCLLSSLSLPFSLSPKFLPPSLFLSFSKKSSPPSLSSPFSVFIAAGREGHLTTAMVQGKVAILPMSCHRVGWSVMACINGGRVWDVTCVQVLWASGREKRKRGK